MEFYKYHGAGNDFIIIEDFSMKFPQDNVAKIAHLCNRRLGIGADGFMLLRPSDQADFKLLYFNADGHLASLCGNGSRCAAAMAFDIGISKTYRISFEAFDGLHIAEILENTKQDKIIKLKMNDVLQWKVFESGLFLDTGSPHLVVEVQDIEDYDVYKNGKRLRTDFNANINFIEEKSGQLHIRTFERGVEDETLSCGTGVTAAALAYSLQYQKHLPVFARGGDFKVDFVFENKKFTQIYLTGPTRFVFEGSCVY